MLLEGSVSTVGDIISPVEIEPKVLMVSLNSIDGILTVLNSIHSPDGIIDLTEHTDGIFHMALVNVATTTTRKCLQPLYLLFSYKLVLLKLQTSIAK